MKNKIIPTQFQLQGHTYKVKFKEGLLRDDGCYGRVNFDTKLIELQPHNVNAKLADSSIEQTYLHEVVHAVLDTVATSEFDPPLRNREHIVDGIASALHQVLKTSKYER